MTKQDVYEFISKHNLAVIATVDESSTPQAAVVEFGEMPDLTIIIDTLKSSRKYKNLQTNKKAAIVIGWDNDITVQMDTESVELAGDDLAKAREVYFSKNPRAKKWADNPDIAYFAFKPNWIRYSDVSKHPWQIEEIEIKLL